jgi:1-hydroxycarotenoid 3,4-desaturase
MNPTTSRHHTVVVGAGMGGLAAAIDLARFGHKVTVIERAAQPGGKVHQQHVAGQPIDAGPTVFTMPWVFESLFADAGQRFDQWVNATPCEILARHAWTDGSRLDLFHDRSRSMAAISAFSGNADADGFGRWCHDSERRFDIMSQQFMSREKPSLAGLVARLLRHHRADLKHGLPVPSLWRMTQRYFEDPRLQQLFSRYATYVGSNPIMTPSTLMLISHVEQLGVWRVQDGMQSLANALERLARDFGSSLHYQSEVCAINTNGNRVSGVELDNGEILPADSVVFNGDHVALNLLLRNGHRKTAQRRPFQQRGLSALTWCVCGKTSGFELDYHNVFFARDYRTEFDAISRHRTISSTPTVYVCAQDRGASELPVDRERLLVLINAPAIADPDQWSAQIIADLRGRTEQVLEQCGLHISANEAEWAATNPADWGERFPESDGSLYGAASHGTRAIFSRPGARHATRGLYLAGGTVHPGPGVPMATLSGRIAAQALLRDVQRSH